MDLIKNNVTLPIAERKLMNTFPIFTNNIQIQSTPYMNSLYPKFTHLSKLLVPYSALETFLPKYSILARKSEKTLANEVFYRDV